MDIESELENLHKAKDLIETDLLAIRTQIDQAKQNANANGTYADREWFQKAQYALRRKGADHQVILVKIGKLRRELKRQSGQASTDYFRKAARELLNKDTYILISQRAIELAEDGSVESNEIG